jgi:hypothetical protein
MMTKKDFIAMAKTVATIVDPYARTQAAIGAAKVCSESNPRFDYAKFYYACGVVVSC